MCRSSISLVLVAWLIMAAVPSLYATEREAPPVSPTRQADEVLHYDWRLRGALSALAGLFLPSRGSGTLTTDRAEAGRIVTELRIESPAGSEGEFWEYGAEIEPIAEVTERVWSSYRWRDKESSKRETLDDGVIDVVSGIWTLRQTPPKSPRRMEIWSDGKLYPVLVLPGASELQSVCGETRTVLHVKVQGVRQPDRRYWKGSLELWLADDAAATPTRIVLDRGWARVQLDLRSRSVDGSSLDCGDDLADATGA